jgi:hypothetical protein
MYYIVALLVSDRLILISVKYLFGVEVKKQ